MKKVIIKTNLGTLEIKQVFKKGQPAKYRGYTTHTQNKYHVNMTSATGETSSYSGILELQTAFQAGLCGLLRGNIESHYSFTSFKRGINLKYYTFYATGNKDSRNFLGLHFISEKELLKKYPEATDIKIKNDDFFNLGQNKNKKIEVISVKKIIT